MSRRVVAPPAAAGHGQWVRTKAGAHKVGQDRHATKIGAHHHVTDFGRHVRRKQIALVTELGQSRVFATVVFLRRKAVAEQVFRGAVAATVVNQNLHKSGVRGVQQFTQIKLRAHAYLLRIARTSLDPAMQVGNRFRAVVTGQCDALVHQFLALPPPIAG